MQDVQRPPSLNEPAPIAKAAVVRLPYGEPCIISLSGVTIQNGSQRRQQRPPSDDSQIPAIRTPTAGTEEYATYNPINISSNYMRAMPISVPCSPGLSPHDGWTDASGPTAPYSGTKLARLSSQTLGPIQCSYPHPFPQPQEASEAYSATRLDTASSSQVGLVSPPITTNRFAGNDMRRDTAAATSTGASPRQARSINSLVICRIVCIGFILLSITGAIIFVVINITVYNRRENRSLQSE